MTSPAWKNNENGLPILDTEEKLRAYIRAEWRGNYEPHHVNAYVHPDHRVVITKTREADLQSVPVRTYGRGNITFNDARVVDPSVIPVLEDAYRKYDAERSDDFDKVSSNLRAFDDLRTS